ncbi:MAG: sigma-70 family RNA polymerase sigma factor [Bacteroidales bacterium]|nr:sigma-70 family RNA polymerase sigma factor [Bacteroidales bacterium]
MSEENQLAKLIQQGDEKAFKTAFELYYEGLVSYGNHLVKNMEVSRDMVQEVFLTLWEKRNIVSIHSSLKAYLFTAINHQALNHIRHNKIKRAFQEQYIATWLYGENKQIAVDPFLLEIIEKAINSLPPKAYQSFALTQIDELSIREAAKIMCVAEKTIDNHLARSRKILKQKLKKYKN